MGIEADREAAMDWIDNHQLSRRNLTADQWKLALGRLYQRSKKQAGAPAGNINASKQLGQNEPVVSTAATLAAEHGVSESTVKRAGKFAAKVESDPQLQQAVREGKPVGGR